MITKRQQRWIELGVCGVAALVVGAVATAQPARRPAPQIVVFTGAARGTAARPGAYEEMARPTGASVPHLSARVRTQVRTGIATALGVPAQSLSEPALATSTVIDTSASTGGGSLGGGGRTGTSGGGGSTSGGGTTEGAASGGGSTGTTVAPGDQPQSVGGTSGGGSTRTGSDPAQSVGETLAAGTRVALEVGAVARLGVSLDAVRPTYAMAGWHWWSEPAPHPMSFAVGFALTHPVSATTTAYELDCAVAASTPRRVSVAIATEAGGDLREEVREVPIVFGGSQPPLGETGRLVVPFTVPAGARPRFVRATVSAGFALQACELGRWR